MAKNFYPRSPCGERPLSTATNAKLLEFLSTLSLRRATCASSVPANRSSFLSTLSLRRATWQSIDKPTEINIFLSTLSLRRATHVTVFLCTHRAISIHALLAESDSRPPSASWVWWLFLSTLSLRRATGSTRKLRMPPWNFYPRSPCGERRSSRMRLMGFLRFLSTLSLRRATLGGRLDALYLVISIHALLAESDPK